MKNELRVNHRTDSSALASLWGVPVSAGLAQTVTGICLDSRCLQPGDLFFALKGIRDGHDFVDSAMKAGAAGCVVERPVQAPHILVPNTLEALWAYAGWYRLQWGKTIVALSGSNGKTTTKEMLGQILGPQTHKTPGTWNNFLGVPLTLLMLEKHHEFGVVEMGINDFGELTKLAGFTRPDIALLTSVGPAHLEKLKDLVGVAKAKGELFQSLAKDGIAVVNKDDPYIEKMLSWIASQKVTVGTHNDANVRLLSQRSVPGGYDLSIRYGNDNLSVRLNLLGKHNVSNYMCALGVALACRIPASQVQERSRHIQSFDMRMQIVNLKGDRTLINDCYNANPGSFEAALASVAELKPKKFLVLAADMLEMGAKSFEIHRDLASKFASFGVSDLFVTGRQSEAMVQGAEQGGLPSQNITASENRSELADKILSKFAPGDILLVKASRGMRLEEVVDDIRRRLEG